MKAGTSWPLRNMGQIDHGLSLYNQGAKNGFYIFKELLKKQNHHHKNIQQRLYVA